MIGYPLDSHVEFDENDVPVFDRAITSVPLRKLIKQLFSDGIMPNMSTNMQVTAGSGMTAVVKSGFAICNGCLKLEEMETTLKVEAANATYGRIDTVVLRLDDNDNVRSCEFAVVKGKLSSNPVRPELTRNQSVWELGLADIKVPAQSVAVRNDRITDTRYESSRCGVISSVSEFDTTGIYQQVQSDLSEFKEGEQTEFAEWFESMKDQLGTDAAGNLLQLIEVERARINALASLKEGSTTGDAELQDIRIGVDGNTYSSAGEAVREQFKNIWTMFAASDVKYSSSEIHLSDASLDVYRTTSDVTIGTSLGGHEYWYPKEYGLPAKTGCYVLHLSVSKGDRFEVEASYSFMGGSDYHHVFITNSWKSVVRIISFDELNENRFFEIEEDGYVYISGYYGDASPETHIASLKTPKFSTSKATVGQILAVAEVDESGKPTKWRTIDQRDVDLVDAVIEHSLNLGRKPGTQTGEFSTVLGENLTASGKAAVATGGSSEAVGDYSHSEGCNDDEGFEEHTVSGGVGSHAEGRGSHASGNASHAEGKLTIASGEGSHAEGCRDREINQKTTASGRGSHAEGIGSQAIGEGSHAEGIGGQTTKDGSHAEGRYTMASGAYGHAEGNQTVAGGEGSHAEGYNTTANGACQHVQGKNNIPDSANKYAHIVGGGTESVPKNIHTVDWEGNAEYAGDVIAKGCGGADPVSLVQLSQELEALKARVAELEN